MASTTLYPPIVRDYEPAFLAGPNAKLRVYFNLSALGEPNNSFWIHASIIKKDGTAVINTTDNITDLQNPRLRKTGTILNINPIEVSTGQYYIELLNEDLKSEVTFSPKTIESEETYQGWIPGWEYKIQLRISTENCGESFIDKQEEWLQTNSDNFSEWSTICTAKALGGMVVICNYRNDTAIVEPDYIDRHEFFGSISSRLNEVFEDYYSCDITLLKIISENNEIMLEKSNTIYNVSKDSFKYIFKTNFENNQDYKVVLNFVTENDYEDSREYIFTYTEEAGLPNDYRLTAIDQIDNSRIKGYTSVAQEEDEGRVALKIYYNSESNVPQKEVYIRRASSKDNFTTWEDIKHIKIDGVEGTQESASTDIDIVNGSAIIYDYSIESGVWYRYGIQPVDNQDKRMAMNIMSDIIQGVVNPVPTNVIRVFEYSYLLGFGEQQLKLEFDNTINNFNTRVSDGSQETIGSKYPFINRANSVYYKNFGINGLISFNMDEQNTFLKQGRKSIYQYDDVVALYNNYNIRNGINVYDYTFERDFRNKVYEFLYRDKPVLYKSPTEGNIVVRLKDVSCTPNQSLGRLIYSFAGTASEIAEPNLESYNKYGLIESYTLLGQMNNTQETICSHTLPQDYNTPTFG